MIDTQSHTVTFASDRATGFPVVRIAENPASYLSLLPLTKVQVERFIASGAAARQLGADGAVSLFQHVSALTDGTYESDQETVVAGMNRTTIKTLLRRLPPDMRQVPENALATNIPLKVSGTVFRGNEQVPQPDSMLGAILQWLRTRHWDNPDPFTGFGGLPRLKEYQDAAQRFTEPTARYLRMAIRSAEALGLDRLARRLLSEWIDNPLFANQTGLPFFHEGIWETVGELCSYHIQWGEHPETHHQVLAVGSCRLLPGLLESGFGGQRLFIDQHPCLGCRPVFNERGIQSKLELEVSG